MLVVLGSPSKLKPMQWFLNFILTMSSFVTPLCGGPMTTCYSSCHVLTLPQEMKFVGPNHMKRLAWVKNCVSCQGALGSSMEHWLRSRHHGRT